MTVEELEKQVWNQDHVRIVARDRSNAKVREYNKKEEPREMEVLK